MASGQPEDTAYGAGAYVSIDETGEFAYHSSEAALLGGFEYVDEAACILNRAGVQYRLVLDEHRKLRLGPALGEVDPEWLKRAWAEALKTHPTAHRLRRMLPVGAGMLAELFEILALEQGVQVPGSLWQLTADGRTEDLPALPDIDHRAAALRQHGGLRVTDPHGHVYRPVWTHPRLVPGKPIYVELPAVPDPIA